MGKRMGQWGRGLRTALAVGSRWAWAWLRRVTPPTASWLWTGVKWAAGWALLGVVWVVGQVLTAVGNWAWDTWPVYAWSIVGAGIVLWGLFAVLDNFGLLNWVPWIRRDLERSAVSYGRYTPVAGDRHKHEARWARVRLEHSHPGGVARHKHAQARKPGTGGPEPVTEGPEPEPASYGPWRPVEGDRHKHDQWEHSHPGGVARHKHYGGWPSAPAYGQLLFNAGSPMPVTEGPEPEPGIPDRRLNAVS